MISTYEELIADSRFAFMHGRYNEALRFAKLAIEQDPKRSDAYQCAGNAYCAECEGIN